MIPNLKKAFMAITLIDMPDGIMLIILLITPHIPITLLGTTTSGHLIGGKSG
jgi:hypothetical protein